MPTTTEPKTPRTRKKVNTELPPEGAVELNGHLPAPEQTYDEIKAERDALRAELDDITKTSVISLTKHCKTVMAWAHEKIRIQEMERQKYFRQNDANRIKQAEIDGKIMYYSEILAWMTELLSAE